MERSGQKQAATSVHAQIQKVAKLLHNEVPHTMVKRRRRFSSRPSLPNRIETLARFLRTSVRR